MQLNEIEVSVNSVLAESIREYLSAAEISEVKNVENATVESPVSLLISQKLETFESAEPVVAGSILWSPAIENWDPWRAANIDEPPLSRVFFLCYH